MFNRIISRLAARVATSSVSKRDLVNIGFRNLEEVTYTRLRDFGFKPSYIVDVGAYSGDWSRSARRIFADAPILMIEARSQEEDNLRKAVAELGNAHYKICLLGASPSDAARFTLNDTGSSIFAERSNVIQTQTVLPMTTLDAVANAPSSSFLKIDCQGAELEILKGGQRTLMNCEVVQLETALLSYNEGAPSSAEVIAFMDEIGFALFEIAGFVRPQDKHLVQIDCVFVRKSSALRPNTFHY